MQENPTAQQIVDEEIARTLSKNVDAVTDDDQSRIKDIHILRPDLDDLTPFAALTGLKRLYLRGVAQSEVGSQ